MQHLASKQENGNELDVKYAFDHYITQALIK